MSDSDTKASKALFEMEEPLAELRAGLHTLGLVAAQDTSMLQCEHVFFFANALEVHLNRLVELVQTVHPGISGDVE